VHGRPRGDGIARCDAAHAAKDCGALRLGAADCRAIAGVLGLR